MASNQKAYSVCDITIASQPTNWLRSDYIDVKDAKILNVELKYNLLGCPESLVCNHKLSIYVLHVEKELVGVDLDPLKAKIKYEKVETIVPTVLPVPKELKDCDYDGKIITKKGGVYLAFLDQGACVSLLSVIVSYNYCSEIQSVLMRFLRTAAPVNDSYLEEQTGRCTDVNSVNKVKLSGVCLSNGEWNITDGIKCLCKPGYELVNATEGNALECNGMNGNLLIYCKYTNESNRLQINKRTVTINTQTTENNILIKTFFLSVVLTLNIIIASFSRYKGFLLNLANLTFFSGKRPI